MLSIFYHTGMDKIWELLGTIHRKPVQYHLERLSNCVSATAPIPSNGRSNTGQVRTPGYLFEDCLLLTFKQVQ